MTIDIEARARRGRRKVFAVAGAAVAVLALGIAAAILVGAHLRSPDRNRSTGSEPRPVTTAAVAPTTVAFAGGVPVRPSVLPSDVTTMQLEGTPVPVSATAGPHNTTAGLASGFAHNSAGAVLAAVNLLVRVSPEAGSSVFGPTIDQQVTGPNLTAFRVQVNDQYQQLRQQAPVADGQPVGDRADTQLRGYQIDLYSATTADIRVLAVSTPPSRQPIEVAFVVQVAWSGTDWSLVAPPGGVWDTSVVSVDPTAAAAFSPFSPGR